MGTLLIELSIGVHRFAMYPHGHPSLEGVVENVLGQLTPLLETRGSLAIGAAQQQLVIEGTTTDPRNPVLAELARRLHDHQLGALSFERGVEMDEVAGLLETLGRDPERDGTPLGLLSEGEMPGWPHARLHRLGYEHLSLREGAPPSAGGSLDRATQLWLGLAQVSVASKEPPTEVPDATAVARSIDGHRRDSAYDQAVMGYLVQLTQEIKSEGDGASGGTRQRVSRLVQEIDDATLARLVAFGGNVAQKHRFVRDANHSLTGESVLKVLRASASSSEQTISHSMTRMLTKLAAHAEEGTGRVRAQAEAALRDGVEALVSDWALDDPNPDAYTLSLDAMAHAAPMFGGTGTEEGSLAEAGRLVEMALEIDAWGPMVERALEELVSQGGSVELVQMLLEAPSGSDVARRSWARVATPDELQRLMSDPQAETGALRAVAIKLREAAVDPLLDLLSDSEDRALRRRAFDVLLSLRSDWIMDRAVPRLADPSWYVQRNMLALLLHFRPPLADLDLMPWCEHEHPRVRREAFALAMTQPSTRERAILMALEDEDERVVRVTLPEIARGASGPVLRKLFDQVLLDISRSEELRVASIRTLAASRSTRVADALVESVTAPGTILGRKRLAPPAPSVVEALSVLAATWREYPRARRVLQLARESRHPELRAAVGAET